LVSLLEPGALADPSSFYRRLLAEQPIFFDESLDAWVVSRYADVVALLRDPRLLRDRNVDATLASLPETEREALRPLFGAFGKQMLFLDPPAHTRLRGLVSKAFTPKAVEGVRASIERMVDAQISARAPSGQMDVIADVAHPLPFTVICEILGVPEESRARFRGWSHDYMTFLSSIPPPPEVLARAARSVVEMSDYLRPLAAERRARPGEDLLSALLHAEEQGQILGEEELFANILLLFLAGHETTTNLIGNGLWLLLRSPGEIERLRADPGLWPSAVNELLRYESPIRLTAGHAGEDIDFKGHQIRNGQFVFLLLAAANRDPEQFADPDRVDVGRKENRHLAFSQGGHFCLGAPLARMEGEIALRALVNRLPGLRLAESAPDFAVSLGVRGLRSLPVLFGDTGNFET
jgi:hypothetical protein